MNVRSLILLVTWCIAFFPGCEEKVRPTVLPEVDPGSLPLQESWSSTVTLSDSGAIKAIIKSGYIRVYEDPRQTLLSEGVVVDFFDDEGLPTSVLTSREGKVDDRTNDLEAWGDVVVVSLSDSTVLRSERLFWDNRNQRVHTPDFVSIVSPTERIQGTGFEAEENLKHYRIFSVSGETQAK
jgi:LPS export ABC transporter protein LptC